MFRAFQQELLFMPILWKPTKLKKKKKKKKKKYMMEIFGKAFGLQHPNLLKWKVRWMLSLKLLRLYFAGFSGIVITWNPYKYW